MAGLSIAGRLPLRPQDPKGQPGLIARLINSHPLDMAAKPPAGLLFQDIRCTISADAQNQPAPVTSYANHGNAKAVAPMSEAGSAISGERSSLAKRFKTGRDRYRPTTSSMSREARHLLDALRQIMRISIVDINPAFTAAALASELSTLATIVTGDFKTLAGDGLVSPANSYGFMDGGIDLAYSLYFGWDLQTKVQDEIKRLPGQSLPVGQAIIVETGSHSYPSLIVAPTMPVPMRLLHPADIMYATRAAVKAAKEAGLRHIVMPGMGTGTGAIRFDVAAQAMAAGIRGAENPAEFPSSWQEAANRYFNLIC